MRGLAGFVCVGLLFAGGLRADESLSPEILAALKSATVFVKVDAKPIIGSGSGFLVRVDGKTAYIVTNHHVIAPTAHFDRGSRHVTITGGKATVRVVFSSGSPNEKTYPAEVLGSDSERDLAILKVTASDPLPRPVDLNTPAAVVETTPVYVFGFPFGQALSADSKLNPAVTVGKGSVSSLRMDGKGNLSAVQIDGALNPGNSGGPVIDAKGHLVGISVAAILGANIGLAIPARELGRMMLGSVGAVHWSADKPEKGRTKITITVDLVDPLNKLTAVSLHYVPTSMLKDPQVKEDIAKLSAAKTVRLKIDGSQASGTFDWLVGDHDSLTFQTAYVNGEHKMLYTPSTVYSLSSDQATDKPSDTSVASPGPENPEVKRPAPSGKLVGKIHGFDFEVARASLAFGTLELTGKDPNFRIVVFFPREKDQDVSGLSFVAGTKSAPGSIHGRWKYSDGRSGAKAWTKFTGTLSFGKVVEDKVQATLSLQIPDSQETFLEGKIDLIVRQ